EMAALGEESARNQGQEQELCEFLAWQAVLARRAGDERRGGRLFAQAAAKRAALRSPPEREYPDAAALYHELGNDLETALQVREWEAALVTNRGRAAYECEAHVKRCGVLARLGRLRTADLDATRELARRLLNPDKALAEIDALAGSV